MAQSWPLAAPGRGTARLARIWPASDRCNDGEASAMLVYTSPDKFDDDDGLNAFRIRWPGAVVSNQSISSFSRHLLMLNMI